MYISLYAAISYRAQLGMKGCVNQCVFVDSFLFNILAKRGEREDRGELCGLSQKLNGKSYKHISEWVDFYRDRPNLLPACYTDSK